MGRSVAGLFLLGLLSGAWTVAFEPSPGEAAEGQEVQELKCPFWRVDRRFETTLRIANRQIFDSVRAVLILGFADGTEYSLPALQLEPGDARELALDDALKALPPSLWPRMTQTGSARLVYEGQLPGAVAASFHVLNKTTGVAFNSLFGAPPDDVEAARVVDGVYWTPDSGGEVFISVANGSDRPIPVGVQILDRRGQSLRNLRLSLNARASYFSYLSDAGETILPGETGGIRVSFFGRPGEILVSGGVENSKNGYSADLPFQHRGVGESQKLTFSAVGVLRGKPDPAAGFPVETRFAPFLTLRNPTERTLAVEVTAHLPGESKPSTVRFPRIVLSPGEATTSDLEFHLARGRTSDYDGPLNITVSYDGKPGDLIFGLGSVDQSGNFVLQAHPHPMGRRPSQMIPFWSVEDGDDSLITVWNPSDAGQNLVLELRYAADGGNGIFRLPLSIGPGASQTVSVRRLMEERTLGEAGEALPLGIMHGSAAVLSSAGPEEFFDAEVGGGVLNTSHGTCSWWCITCEGYLYYRILPDLIADVIVGGNTGQFTAEARHVSYGPADFTYSSVWSSSDENYLTVQNGVLTAVSYKATPIGITARKALPKYESYYCAYNPLCPSAFTFQDTGSARTRKPRWSIPTYMTDQTQGCILSSPSARKDVHYGAFDDYGQLGFQMDWTLNEDVVSQSSCGVATGGSIQDQVTFHDVIFNCTSNCTFQSRQRFTVRIQNQMFDLKPKKCFGTLGCPEGTAWAVTATKANVKVELFTQ